MAEIITRTLVDDLDGTADATPRTFGIDGVWYDIDLTDANYAKMLEKPMASLIEKARRRGGKKITKTRVRTTQSRADSNAIRDWARQQGKTVSGRGRIPQDVVDAFNAEHTPAFSDKQLVTA